MIDCLESVQTNRLILEEEIYFSEIISALSVALDITQGHPQGHSMRSALIGMRLADEIGLPKHDLLALFYALLLKDLGCSSNSAKIAYLLGSDDLTAKHSARLIDFTNPLQRVKHCWGNCAVGQAPLKKVMRMGSLLGMKPAEAHAIAQIRCNRGAEIARMLHLPELTAEAIYHLDEHWNGKGNPDGLKGEAIPLLARICCLAQTAEVFFSEHGLPAAIEVVRERRGRWFDPQLVDAFLAFRDEAEFWQRLLSHDLVAELQQWDPPDSAQRADGECLDRVAEAFAMVVDAKSPWTYKHSTRVAEMSVGIAQQLGCSTEVIRDIRRAALLHDIGKLGVSNAILDKAGKPTDEEFAQIRKHPDFSRQILLQVQAFHLLADVAGAHHERLDGRGYHRRLDGASIPWAARILTVADICEALTAQRPYRDAMSWEQANEILTRDIDTGVERECLEALHRWYDRVQIESRVEDQLEQVDLLLSGS